MLAVKIISICAASLAMYAVITATLFELNPWHAKDVSARNVIAVLWPLFVLVVPAIVVQRAIRDRRRGPRARVHSDGDE